MKRIITYLVIFGFCLSGTLVSVAVPIDKSKPAYVWFDKCIDEKDLDCIESLGIVDEAGIFIPGKPTGFSNPSPIAGSVENKTSGFIDYVGVHPNKTWEIPSLKTEYGNSYVITEFSLVTGVGSWYDAATNKTYPSSGINGMRFAVLAVPTIEGFANNLWGVSLKNFDHKCVTQDYKNEMVCQRTANFSSEQKLQATLRFSWYRASQVQSNLKENSYVVEELGGGATRVTVSGKPIERPYFVDSPSLDRNVYNRVKADSLSSQWEIASYDSSDSFTPSKCRDKGIPIVAGNMYSQTSPTRDSKTGDLTVNVWAPHLDPSGKEFKGYYEGNFPNAYASCLWGVDASKIADELVVSVINEGVESNKVVTTSLVKTSTGIRIIATGFHYSYEQIKFHRRIASASNTIQTITPEPAPALSVPLVDEKVVNTGKPIVGKKRTIVCYKGKTVKKVSAMKPTCPKGYKKLTA